ncbi:glycosyltransferase family 9 protein [Vulgatibacter incomptus]|uniref:ADP-heptose--lipooligosaccharide heptosyltransferase II n=1 Tax=Vulgatibacter incomptus TaxID=1391653 RepID=A0A0K1PAT6_9BACT|nr:glycosyltransferase family 9 protein [Vulgatibacter incomptus]AKU90617.1 ADP-heptose--lipooligosaccharide heptosyltransferase II [Vulgatibacter incomptus]
MTSVVTGGPRVESAAGVRRILVLRTSALGDTVLATPALRALRERFADAEIHFVTHAAFVRLFDELPFVTRTWAYEPKGRHRGAAGLLSLAAALRHAGPFDLAIDLQNKLATRALVGLARPRSTLRFVKRRGVAAIAASIVGEGPILDDLPAAALYLDALRPLGIERERCSLAPEVALDSRAETEAELVVAAARGAPIAALAPGGRWALKQWDPRRFAEVGDALAESGARIVLVGGPGDRRELDAVAAFLSAPPLAETSALDVPALTAVIGRSSVLVTADSAPSHLAQAVGTPVVAVFGPTSRRRWGPLPDAGAAIALPIGCAPCTNHGKRPCRLGHRACLDQLPAKPVIAAALAALRAGRKNGGKAAAEASSGEIVDLAMHVARSRLAIVS